MWHAFSTVMIVLVYNSQLVRSSCVRLHLQLVAASLRSTYIRVRPQVSKLHIALAVAATWQI